MSAPEETLWVIHADKRGFVTVDQQFSHEPSLAGLVSGADALRIVTRVPGLAALRTVPAEGIALSFAACNISAGTTARH